MTTEKDIVEFLRSATLFSAIVREIEVHPKVLNILEKSPHYNNGTYITPYGRVKVNKMYWRPDYGD